MSAETCYNLGERERTVFRQGQSLRGIGCDLVHGENKDTAQVPSVEIRISSYDPVSKSEYRDRKSIRLERESVRVRSASYSPRLRRSITFISLDFDSSVGRPRSVGEECLMTNSLPRGQPMSRSAEYLEVPNGQRSMQSRTKASSGESISNLPRRVKTPKKRTFSGNDAATGNRKPFMRSQSDSSTGSGCYEDRTTVPPRLPQLASSRLEEVPADMPNGNEAGTEDNHDIPVELTTDRLLDLCIHVASNESLGLQRVPLPEASNAYNMVMGELEPSLLVCEEEADEQLLTSLESAKLKLLSNTVSALPSAMGSGRRELGSRRGSISAPVSPAFGRQVRWSDTELQQ